MLTFIRNLKVSWRGIGGSWPRVLHPQHGGVNPYCELDEAIKWQACGLDLALEITEVTLADQFPI